MSEELFRKWGYFDVEWVPCFSCFGRVVDELEKKYKRPLTAEEIEKLEERFPVKILYSPSLEDDLSSAGFYKDKLFYRICPPCRERAYDWTARVGGNFLASIGLAILEWRNLRGSLLNAGISPDFIKYCVDLAREELAKRGLRPIRRY